MRTARLKVEYGTGYYHCVSRVVNRDYVLGEVEKEQFVKWMRRYAEFCGVRVVTFCVMSNHFHVLVEVPERPSEDELEHIDSNQFEDDFLLKTWEELERDPHSPSWNLFGNCWAASQAGKNVGK